MKDNKVLIEKYKGFEIYYDKEKERFVADKVKLDIHFEARTLWEIEGYIKESQTKEVDKFVYIKSGYFNKSIAKIHLLTINNATKKCKYKIIEDSGSSYNVGKIKDDEDLPEMYDITKENTQIYEKVKKLQNEIETLEEKQEKLVCQLK